MALEQLAWLPAAAPPPTTLLLATLPLPTSRCPASGVGARVMMEPLAEGAPVRAEAASEPAGVSCSCADAGLRREMEGEVQSVWAPACASFPSAEAPQTSAVQKHARHGLLPILILDSLSRHRDVGPSARHCQLAS